MVGRGMLTKDLIQTSIEQRKFNEIGFFHRVGLKIVQRVPIEPILGLRSVGIFNEILPTAQFGVFVN